MRQGYKVWPPRRLISLAIPLLLRQFPAIVETCKADVTFYWDNCQDELTIRTMGQHLAETTRILRWKYANAVFALLALLSAGAAMALPGPAGDITGFSTVLFVGALALLAGHHWGILVVAAAEVLILGKTWPIVIDAITSDASSGLAIAAALTTSLCALPGLVLFAVTLPFSVEVIIGEKDTFAQRPGELLSMAGACFWLLSPIAPFF